MMVIMMVIITQKWAYVGLPLYSLKALICTFTVNVHSTWKPHCLNEICHKFIIALLLLFKDTNFIVLCSNNIHSFQAQSHKYLLFKKIIGLDCFDDFWFRKYTKLWGDMGRINHAANSDHVRIRWNVPLACWGHHKGLLSRYWAAQQLSC